MKVLIIFEQTNDRRIKAVVEMTSKDYEFFKDANEHFIHYNEYDTHKARAVNTLRLTLLKGTPDQYKFSLLSEHEKIWRGKFSDAVIDSVSDIKDIDKFIHCGWGCT